jgi:hypothetical protein
MEYLCSRSIQEYVVHLKTGQIQYFVHGEGGLVVERRLVVDLSMYVN